MIPASASAALFQLTAARRRLRWSTVIWLISVRFQLTAARRRLRPHHVLHTQLGWCFNSQPPEGGCAGLGLQSPELNGFNSQPPEGGCQENHLHRRGQERFNSQPPEGGCSVLSAVTSPNAGFQLTAARRRLRATAFLRRSNQPVSTHSRPKAAAKKSAGSSLTASFQLTAARRRLLSTSKSAKNQLITNSLSLTHSDVREFGKYSVRFCAIQPYK